MYRMSWPRPAAPEARPSTCEDLEVKTRSAVDSEGDEKIKILGNKKAWAEETRGERRGPAWHPPDPLPRLALGRSLSLIDFSDLDRNESIPLSYYRTEPPSSILDQRHGEDVSGQCQGEVLEAGVCVCSHHRTKSNHRWQPGDPAPTPPALTCKPSLHNTKKEKKKTFTDDNNQSE